MQTLFTKDLIFIEKGSMVFSLNEKAPTVNRGLFETTTSKNTSSKRSLKDCLSVYKKRNIFQLFFLYSRLFFSAVVSINFFMEAHNV